MTALACVGVGLQKRPYPTKGKIEYKILLTQKPGSQTFQTKQSMWQNQSTTNIYFKNRIYSAGLTLGEVNIQIYSTSQINKTSTDSVLIPSHQMQEKVRLHANCKKLVKTRSISMVSKPLD